MKIIYKQNTKLLFIKILLILFSSSEMYAQEFKVSAYVEAYYAYDNDKNGIQLRQFSSVAPVRDEFRIDLAQVTGKYTSEKIRGTAVLQFGDIPKYNWPQAPNEYLQYIQEANVGFSPVKNLWVDVGYFLTHIGGEGVIRNNYLSSITLLTVYEPFFQSGIRVSYDFSPKFYGSVYLLNGYNVLADNNKNKSGGLQLGFKPTPQTEIIYNNITGNEQAAGSIGKTRIYNDLVIKHSLSNKVDLLLGLDYAVQEKSKLTDTTKPANVFAGLLSIRYKITPKFFIIGRGEFYKDDDGILSGTFADSSGSPKGLKASGFTIGIEHSPFDNTFIRAEARYLKTGNSLNIFSDGTTRRDYRTELMLTSGVEF
ncbi:MAG: outer membrane beta-barrel protein [bacterium]